MMKRSICKVISLSAALGLILTCAACGDASNIAEMAEKQEVSVQNAVAVTPLSGQQGAKSWSNMESGPMTEKALTLTKDQLYYRCLNTLEYLDQLSGTVSFLSGCNTPTILEGYFDFDFTQDTYHAVVHHLDAADDEVCLQTSEYYNDGGEVVSLYDYQGSQPNTYTIEQNGVSLKNVVFANACPQNPEEVTQSNGKADAAVTSIQEISENKLYATMGMDPTNAHELGACFIPQEMSVGYLENFDNWGITGTTEFQGRTCAVVTGTAEEAYGSRFGVETFAILIDQETGIWLQYEGYDAAGTVQSYLYTEDILFGTDANDVPAFSAEMTSGYAYIDHYSNLSAEERMANEMNTTE